MRSTQRSLCAAMLVLQAVVLFLTTPVMISVADVSVSTGLLIGLGLTVACLLAAGMLRKPVGFMLGWAVQVASLALGLVITEMFFLGAVFAGLWAAAYFMGRKIDAEKAERALLEEEWRTEHRA
jgi:hypothetical protein